MNLKNSRAALLLAITLLLPGCADMKANVAEDNPRADTAQAPQAQSLLAYAASLRGRSSTELAAELDALNRAYAQHHGEDNRLRLAIFHALTPGGDRARALSLLDLPPGDNIGRGRNHPIAVLLIPLLQENRRADDNLVASQQRLRDEQKRGDALQQKLDAIRDIEKKMIERPSGTTSGTTGKTP
jgi:hypothetical protein